jgi:hypothetical protein
MAERWKRHGDSSGTGDEHVLNPLLQLYDCASGLANLANSLIKAALPVRNAAASTCDALAVGQLHVLKDTDTL